MIDHMLVNLKKYYEGRFPCYIGMNIKAPKSGLPAYYMADSPVDGADMLLSTAKPSLTPAELENKEVLAQRLNGLDDFYLLIQPAGYYSYINCWIKLSDLVKNGGVSASLTHVCHALSLVRKVLSMAIEKMKYQLQDWYQGKMQNYIGRSVTLPKTKIRFYDIHDSRDVMPSGSYTDCQHGKILGNIGTVNGQFFVGNDTFLTISFPFEFDYDEVHTVWLKMSDILQNGGVSSSPLTHLYQGLRHLLDRKVALAND